MRPAAVILLVASLLAACSPAQQSPATQQPAAPAAAQSEKTTPAVTGVRVTLDGQPVPVEGQPKFYFAEGAFYPTIYVDIGTNVGEKAQQGYGVRLAIQAAKDQNLNQGFTLGVQGLTLSSTKGTLAGSYSDNISGLMGKFAGKIEFGVPFPG